jgi:hypothetical protein
MARTHKRHKKPREMEHLPAGSDPGKFYHQLPDGTISRDPGQALSVRRAGGEVHSFPRLGNARIFSADDIPREPWEQSAFDAQQLHRNRPVD